MVVQAPLPTIGHFDQYILEEVSLDFYTTFAFQIKIQILK